MKRSESCIFLRFDKNNYDNQFGASKISSSDVIQTSLASIGINCSQEIVEKLCNDILHLGEGKENVCHPTSRESSDEQHNNQHLLLLKVDDILQGLLTISEESMEEEEDDDNDDDPSSNVHGRPAF